MKIGPSGFRMPVSKGARRSDARPFSSCDRKNSGNSRIITVTTLSLTFARLANATKSQARDQHEGRGPLPRNSTAPSTSPLNNETQSYVPKRKNNCSYQYYRWGLLAIIRSRAVGFIDWLNGSPSHSPRTGSASEIRSKPHLSLRRRTS
jgi:hypothetical protein